MSGFPRTSIAALATVELQLVMQHLDLRSFLALARCDTHSLAAASTEFACTYQLVSVSLGDENAIHRPGTSRILRHCHISIDAKNRRLNDAHPHVSSALELPRIRELTGIDFYQSIERFARPSLAHVTSIHGTLGLGNVTCQCVFGALLTHFPSVEHLGFVCVGMTSHELLAPLAKLTRLRTLSLYNPSNSFTAAVLDACTSLRELEFVHMPSSILSSLLSSTGAQRLECITLENWWHIKIDWQLGNLESLRRLELRGCDDFINVLLRNPHGVPALESLILFPPTHKKESRVNRTDFEVVVLQRPHVSFCLAFRHLGWLSIEDDVRNIYEPVARAYPHRITVRMFEKHWGKY
jgi:hypothetical protein